jgi:hypothetical protein
MIDEPEIFIQNDVGQWYVGSGRFVDDLDHRQPRVLRYSSVWAALQDSRPAGRSVHFVTKDEHGVWHEVDLSHDSAYSAY